MRVNGQAAGSHKCFISVQHQQLTTVHKPVTGFTLTVLAISWCIENVFLY